MRLVSKFKPILYNAFINKFFIHYDNQLKTADLKETFEEDFKIWKRFLMASNKEKEWINQRITWFFTPQTILFATFSLINAKDISHPEILKYLNIALPVIGIASSLLVLVAIVSALRMHGIWHANLKKIVSRYTPDIENLSTADQLLWFKYHNRLTFGRGPDWPAVASRWAPALVILLFIVAWFVLLVCFYSTITPLHCSECHIKFFY